jgi:hypothetical protein
MNKQDFSKEVEDFVVKTQSSYMDAIITLAEKKNMELESVSKMLNSIIKQKVEAEASDANMLKVKICKLPI